MAGFVLVHGSTQNSGCWSAVAELLRRHGHHVATPELPKRAPDWGFEQYAAAIARGINTPDTIVVAHSMSGAFLPLVPGIRPCRALVFLAAAIPEPGRSAREQCADEPSMLSPGWMAAGVRWFDKAQHERLAKEFLFHDCDDETVARAISTVELLDARRLSTVPHPLRTWPHFRRYRLSCRWIGPSRRNGVARRPGASSESSRSRFRPGIVRTCRSPRESRAFSSDSCRVGALAHHGRS